MWLIWNGAWCGMQCDVRCSPEWNVQWDVECVTTMWWDVAVWCCGVQYVVVCDVDVTHSTSHYHALVTHFTPCFVTSHHHTAQNSHIILQHSHITCRIMCTMWCCDEMWCDVMWFCDMEWCMMRCGAMRYGTCYNVTTPCFATSHQHNSTSKCTTFNITPHLFM